MIEEPVTQEPETSKAKGQKRRDTEASIVAAFDRLVRRVGVRAVGVNALVHEAGVGKGLIYKYFGGLSGVVKVWAEANKLWPSTAELMANSDEAFSGLDPAGRIKAVVLNHISALRDNPLSTDVMADELMAPSEISAALSEARVRLGQEHQAIHAANHALRAYDNRSVVMILVAAANYLAMRAAHAPRFMGEALNTEEGWQGMLARLERVVELAVGDGRRTATADPMVPGENAAPSPLIKN